MEVAEEGAFGIALWQLAAPRLRRIMARRQARRRAIIPCLEHISVLAEKARRLHTYLRYALVAARPRTVDRSVNSCNPCAATFSRHPVGPAAPAVPHCGHAI